MIDRGDNTKKATAILQGRIGSTRLPEKVFLSLLGKPVIQQVYERILYCRNYFKSTLEFPYMEGYLKAVEQGYK